MSYEHVRELLKEMKLDGISSVLDSTLEEWSKNGKDATELIEELLEAEKKSLETKKYETMLKYSGFPFHKNLDEFDFTFQPSIDVKKIKELKTLRFIYEKENVIFLGPPGVGKTHLAVGLGMEAIREGKKAYFINAITLIDKLKRSFYERSFEKQIKFYKSLDLLIIDELGYLPLDSEGAKLFFELISEKYEQGSVIVTSNRSFNEWNKIFEDAVIASALLDRLLHHSAIINIRGKSYRLREKQKSGMIKLETSKITDESVQI